MNDIKTNYQIAKEEADKVDEQIIDILQHGYNFRVEAGAGSGKTYSLKKVIDWIQTNKFDEYNRKKQSVVCITYTNVAVEVIAERLTTGSFIIPSTIHSFAWESIKQYQSKLIDIIKENERFETTEGDFSEILEVQYTLGHRYKENGVLHLYHDDVIFLFCTLLDNEKFRRIFSDKYPLILIDEYQDSFESIIERFLKYFISKNTGPQFGFFGDSWQTIYQSNKTCGLIDHENLRVINKISNFRSSPKIVKFLNDIRPELQQISAENDYEGEVVVVTCEDYKGSRRTDRFFKDELPIEELKDRIDTLSNHIKQQVPLDEKLKVLMITHRVLAAQQGYEKLLDCLSNGLRDKKDIFLEFFMDTIEPIYNSLKNQNMQLLFDALKIKRYPITSKLDKVKWKKLEEQLDVARKRNSIDVVKTAVESHLIPVPQAILGYYEMYFTAPETTYSNTTIENFLNLEYEQFLAAIDFLYPESKFSTEHGVKGEEYDNVIFVIGRGWNQYQFEKYIPMIKNGIDMGKEAAYIRNRNLFYVCCSRPKKRLVLFVSVPLNNSFKTFLTELVGEENIFTYSEYITGKE